VAAVSDFQVVNSGSVVVFTPQTPQAKQWVADHLPLESWQWLGQSFVIDQRYAFDILDGIVNDGLEVQ